MALCCDYRIMADHELITIGLNELPVGIMVPPSIFHLYAFWIGYKNAYQNLLSGRLLNPQEAKSQNLIDELTSPDKVLSISKLKMKEILNFDQATWRGMKQNLRLDLVKKMKEDKINGHLDTVDHFVNNNGKKILLSAMEKLKSKKSS